MSAFELTKTWASLNALELEAAAVYAAANLDEAAAAAARGSLSMYAGKVDELGPAGRLGQAVLAGTMDEAKWVNVANYVGQGLTALINDLHDADQTVARVWSEIVLPSADELGQDLKDAGNALKNEGPGLLKWAVVGLVAIAVVYVTSKVSR